MQMPDWEADWEGPEGSWLPEASPLEPELLVSAGILPVTKL